MPLPTDATEKTIMAVQLRGKSAYHLPVVRSRCIDRANAHSTNVELPLRAGEYTCTNLGSMELLSGHSNILMHNVDYLFPANYECQVHLELHLVGRSVTDQPSFTTSPAGAAPVVRCDNTHYRVTLTTKLTTVYIEREVGKGQTEVVPSPVCEVYLGSRLVAADANPRKAWSAITAAPQAVLAFLGRDMQRCRAILNRLCVAPMLRPFVDIVDERKKSKVEMNPTCMWLREVWRRLTAGVYDTPTDFVFDVREVFKLEGPMRPDFDHTTQWEHACTYGKGTVTASAASLTHCTYHCSSRPLGSFIGRKICSFTASPAPI